MNFVKSNIRISLSLSPGEPRITDDRLLHVKTLKILSADNPRTCVHRFCNSLSSIKLLWITTYTRHSYIVSQLILLLQDTPKLSLLFRESLSLLPCCSLSPEYPYLLGNRSLLRTSREEFLLTGRQFLDHRRKTRSSKYNTRVRGDFSTIYYKHDNDT